MTTRRVRPSKQRPSAGRPPSPPGRRTTLRKARTGIAGLDEITDGGLPKGRPTLVCGGAGCGKTLLGMEFLVRGATQFGEPGVFFAFEESRGDLAKNVASLGFDLKALQAQGRLVVEHIRVERSEFQESGQYDLEGLFLRLGHAIDSVKAKRVVLDTLEALFSNLGNQAVLRSELRRLFEWLRKRGVTTVITGERGEAALTRHGLEEYVSDCVIVLENRLSNQLATRTLRIVKYRGSVHGTNEYPFLIDEHGFAVLPITSLGLQGTVSREQLATGIPRLDAMLGGKGVYRGSSVLISGSTGTGKSTIAAHFVNAACGRGQRCLYFAFEESESQILRNMAAIGLHLQRWVDKGLLRFQAARPSASGPEMHVATLHKIVREFVPDVVVVDPITGLGSTGDDIQVKNMVLHVNDFLKGKGITSVFTALTTGDTMSVETSAMDISSLIDTWVFIRNIESDGERNRALVIIKSRGMAHSNQMREFVITSEGAQLLDVYNGLEGVLMGSARLARDRQQDAAIVVRRLAAALKEREMHTRRKGLEAEIAVLRSAFETQEAEMRQSLEDTKDRDRVEKSDQSAMSGRRGGDRTVKARSSARKGHARTKRR